MGALTVNAFCADKFISLNLSMFFPDLTPQKSTALTNSSVVRLITNSPLFLIRLYEYRSGLTDIYVTGGCVV